MQGVSIFGVLCKYLVIKRRRFSELASLMKGEGLLKQGIGPLSSERGNGIHGARSASMVLSRSLRHGLYQVVTREAKGGPKPYASSRRRPLRLSLLAAPNHP